MGPGLGITGMVLGIVAAVFFWIPFLNVALAVLALIFGIVGIFLNSGKGMAIAGAVLGGLALIASIVFWIFVVSETENAVRDIQERIEQQQQQQQQQQTK
jgi:hypothetical protein